MNILYLSYDGMTDPLGQSQVLPYLKGLSRKSYSFTLISFEKRERFAKNKEIIQKVCDDNQIKWEPLIYTKSPPVLSTLKDVRQMRKLVLELHASGRFDLIHCRSYIAAIVGLEMKQKYGVKFIFDMRGFWADERVDGGIWNLSNPVFKIVYSYFKKKEKEFFSQADYVISLTHAGKKEIHAWDLPNQPIPIQVIPCCADLNFFNYNKIETTQREVVRKKLGFEKADFIITYLGSVGTWYMLREMLVFFKELSKTEKKAKLFFISKDSSELIYTEAKKLGIDTTKIIIQGAEREEVPYFLSLTNLGLFFIKPVFSKKASSPTKQGEMMGMGIPIVCNDIGDTGKIVEEEKIGIVVNDFSTSHLKTVVEKVRQVSQIDKEQIRNSAFKYYSLAEGVKNYAKVYQSILKDS